MYESQFTSTGHSEFIEEAPDKIPDFDPRSGDHLWISTAVYKVNPEKMLTGESSIMDHEVLLAIVGPGCYYCEQVYSPLIARCKCKGHP